jgi:hypothetical protein
VANERGHSPNLLDSVVLEPMSNEGSKAGKADSERPRSYKSNPSQRTLERATTEGDSPVDERGRLLICS